jgi:hypothetical protein
MFQNSISIKLVVSHILQWSRHSCFFLFDLAAGSLILSPSGIIDEEIENIIIPHIELQIELHTPQTDDDLNSIIIFNTDDGLDSRVFFSRVPHKTNELNTRNVSRIYH